MFGYFVQVLIWMLRVHPDCLDIDESTFLLIRGVVLVGSWGSIGMHIQLYRREGMGKSKQLSCFFTHGQVFCWHCGFVLKSVNPILEHL